jgi:stage IV sporulation protein B
MIARCIGILLCALLIGFNYGEQMRLIRALPGETYIDEKSEGLFAGLHAPFGVRVNEEGRAVSGDLGESLQPAANGGYFATVELFGFIPLKQVRFLDRSEVRVMPGGQSVGVTLYTKGALVVGMGTVNTGEGAGICPAQEAGIHVGDVILYADAQEVDDADHLVRICNAATGEISMKVLRGEDMHTLSLRPVQDAEDGVYKMGMWVRDSTAGIGTLSFYSMRTMRYGALGHPITDVDTGSRLSVKNGEIIHSSVLGVSAGISGVPGEIRGAFSMLSQRLGTIDTNCAIGIYGEMYADSVNPIYPQGVLLAYPEEVRMGPAVLLTTVDSEGVKAYTCEILKAYPQSSAAGKGMVIRITDPELIEKTGGIVQGMSGSPILQDGKLVGAVTHVFVNDPLKGYCIYALWMQELCGDT